MPSARQRPRRALARWPSLLGGSLIAAILGVSVGPPAAAGDFGWRPVRSLTELRNAGVVRQHWDLTCGAAAIATLMTYQLRRTVTERQVAVAMLHQTNPMIVRLRLGFSLLDLKHYATAQGLEATGYGGLTLDDVAAMAPLIVPVRTQGFRHFVVLRGRIGDQVLIADPAFGNRVMRADVFDTNWANHVGFTVTDPSEPHPPNRMGAPRELILEASDQTLRVVTALRPLRAMP